MLVNTKARVGVFSIALGAYLPQFPSLVPEFEAQYEAFKKTIPDTVEIIDGGMVTTKEQSMEAGDKFRSADVDIVFLQMLTYATSYNMLPAIRDLDVPVVLVNVQKLKALDYDHTDIAAWLGEGYACGAVGEAVADLERAGKRHAVITGVVEGGDPAVQAEIEDWCKAAQVRRRFRDTNIAQIGRPYPGMMDLYIDETNLYNRMFLYTKQFDWEKMWAIADDVTDEEQVRAYLRKLVRKEAFDRRGLIYGMGHAVYSLSDPRAVVFKSFVESLAKEKGRMDDYHLYTTIERLAPEVIAEKRKIYKGVSANVDFYSGFVYSMLGIPVELYTPIFAMARVVGWSAHRMEELVNADKIIRPAYKSVAEKRIYQPIDKRQERELAGGNYRKIEEK